MLAGVVFGIIAFGAILACAAAMVASRFACEVCVP
jgi:hypothetical protein